MEIDGDGAADLTGDGSALLLNPSAETPADPELAAEPDPQGEPAPEGEKRGDTGLDIDRPFALEEALKDGAPGPGGDFWLVSFGAGFSAHSCRIGR